MSEGRESRRRDPEDGSESSSEGNAPTGSDARREDEPNAGPGAADGEPDAGPEAAADRGEAGAEDPPDERAHLADVGDDCGCVEIWERLSAYRNRSDAGDPDTRSDPGRPE